MRVACLIPWLVIGLLFPGQIPSLFGQGVATLIHDVSDVADGSVTQARLEAQRQAASGDLAYRSYTKGDPSSFSGKYTPPELPDEKKGRFVYGLALFSDDGCNVTVNGSLIHQRMGQGQHLPSIGDSFHVLQTALAPGEPIDITVDYSNIIYDDDPDSPGYPDIDGCTLFLYLIPMAIAVDANRDGTIAFSGDTRDTTSQDAPFRFWCNDDDDNVGTEERDIIPPGQPDSQDDQIDCRRDLEDFARLHINIGGLEEAIANGDIQVGLGWRNVEPVEGSSPSIKVYQAAEPDGGDEYVRNSDEAGTWATKQVSGRYTSFIDTVTPNSHSFRFPSWFWESTPEGLHAFDADHANRYLLFEGVTKGKGQLVLTFWKGTTPIGEGGGCWLDIKDIKKMYERYKAMPEGIAPPYNSSTGQFNNTSTAQKDEMEQTFAKPSDETKDCLVFVHGWNTDHDGAVNTAETMFK
jgi:hypothetical protein